MDIGRELRFQGHWWPPDSPEAKVAGELRCSRDGRADLSLLGSFNGVSMLRKDSRLDIILGISDEGKLVTLVDNLLVQEQRNFRGVPRQKYRTKFVIVGEHFADLDKLQFSAVTFRTYGLDEWVGISGLQVEPDFSKPKFPKFLIKFEPPEPLEYSLDQERRIAIRFSWRSPDLKPLRSISIEQSTHLSLEYSRPRLLDEALVDVYKIKNLVSLCIGKPLSLTEASLTPFSGSDNLLARSVDPVHLYYQSLPSPEDSFEIHSHEMILGWPAISSKFGELLYKWFALYEQISPTINLFFAIQHQKHLYLEYQFLALVQGLESLHRRTTHNQLEPEEIYRERLKRIFSVLEDEDKAWLEPRLKYSNELPLRHRLKELLEPFDYLFGTNKERKKFLNAVVNTRNYLVHYDESLEKEAAQGADLFDLIRQLKLLVVLHVFRLLGFEEDEFYRKVAESLLFRI